MQGEGSLPVRQGRIGRHIQKLLQQRRVLELIPDHPHHREESRLPTVPRQHRQHRRKCLQANVPHAVESQHGLLSRRIVPAPNQRQQLLHDLAPPGDDLAPRAVQQLRVTDFLLPPTQFLARLVADDCLQPRLSVLLRQRDLSHCARDLRVPIEHRQDLAEHRLGQQETLQPPGIRESSLLQFPDWNAHPLQVCAHQLGDFGVRREQDRQG